MSQAPHSCPDLQPCRDGYPRTQDCAPDTCTNGSSAPTLLSSRSMKEHLVRTTQVVMFKFSPDGDKFRWLLFEAILNDRCPDFECSLGSQNGGASYIAMWRPENADAVRAWSRSVGFNVMNLTEDHPALPAPSIELPDIGDIAPGGMVAPCIANAEKMLADQGLEPTALNWIAVCDHFLSLPLIQPAHVLAFRLLRQGIERAALGAVRISATPTLAQDAGGLRPCR